MAFLGNAVWECSPLVCLQNEDFQFYQEPLRYKASKGNFLASLFFQVDQMFAAFPPDVTGNLDYKNLVHIITHGEEKD